EIGREGDRLVERRVLLLPGGAGRTLRDLDADPLREVADRVLETQPQVLHVEGEDVARGATAEAVVETLRRDDVEGGRPFLVERAEAPVILAGTLQRDVLADHLHDVGPRTHLFDDAFGDHSSSAIVTPAPPSPGPPARKERIRGSSRSSRCTVLRTAPVPSP